MHAGIIAIGRTARKGLAALMLAMLAGYRFVVSPVFYVLGVRCRFYPSCSRYAAQAVKVHGPIHGSWLALKRLAKCAPYHPGGVDPVPAAGEAQTKKHQACCHK